MMQQQLRQTLILLGLPCLCTLLLAILLWNLPHDIHINIGQPTDAAYLEGFHERSLQSAPPFASYRWTTPQAEVILPAVPAPAQVQLQLAAPPGGTTLELVANDQKLGAFTIVPDTLRSYESLWRGSPRGDGTFTLGLHAPASRIGDDERPLGVLVSRITVTPLGWSLPPWLPLVCLLALVMAGWQSARLLGAPALAASLAASLLGMGMALGWGLARLWVAPFLGVAALGAVAVSGTLTLLHWRTAARESLRPADLLALFAVCTTAIPVYLYLRIGWPNPPTFYDILLALLPLGLLALWSEGTTRRVALGGVLAVALVFLGIGLVETFRSDFSRDFLAIYRGVARFVHGTGPLYLLDVIQANPLDATFKYPPTFALLFAPFTWLSFVPAFYSWKVFNLLLLLASCALLLHTYRISWRSGAAAGLLLLACTLAPLIDSLRFGQLDLVLLFLLTLGLHAVRQGHNTWFGALVGLAAAIKIYPLYMLGLALVQRRWGAFGGAAGTVALVALLALAVFGWPVQQTFVNEVLPLTGVGTGWIENQTLNGFLNRLAPAESIGLLPDGGAWQLHTYAWALTITLLTAYLCRPGGGLALDQCYSLWLIAMLIIPPAAWIHYQTLLLIPFFQVFASAEQRSHRWRWPLVGCYLLAWALLAQGDMWAFFSRVAYGPFWQLILSYKFYGLLLLYLAIARTRSPTRVPR